MVGLVSRESGIKTSATYMCVCVCLMCRQSVLIAVLVKLGALPESWKEYDVEDVSLGLQVHH